MAANRADNRKDGGLGSAHVSAVRGPALDILVCGPLPRIGDAVDIRAHDRTVMAEVQAQIDHDRVRVIAFQSTLGVARVASVKLTGGPLAVPKGDEMLGRLINVLGEVGDRGPPFPIEMQSRPIHRAAPTPWRGPSRTFRASRAT